MAKLIRIKRINIKNYRKFRFETVSLDSRITAFAGANNSGKTSLVELMSNIFIKEKRDSINIEDMNNRALREDEKTISGIINNDSLDDEGKIQQLEGIHKKLNKITVDLIIEYDKDNENIENFARYLADVDITKRNFYFRIEYEYIPVKEKEIIEILDGNKDFREIYSNLQSKVYYCNQNFEDKINISNKSDFYNLFNYHCVYAIRKLSDTSEEKQNFLSKHLLKTVQNNQSWKENLKFLISNINKILNDQNLSREIDKITLSQIKRTLDSFSKTNGGNTGELGIDFRLENKDIEKVLLDFIQVYFEQDEGSRIKEQKQGLGYSNLIYLLLEAQIFSEKIDNSKVNLLIFEEPEAHLHPQMEHIFIRYISDFNKATKTETETEIEAEAAATIAEVAATVEIEEPEETTKGAIKEVIEDITEDSSTPFQMMITTHSSEMTKTIGLNNIRVLRSNGHTEAMVYDLHNFMSSLTDPNRIFYEKFFQFNMVEIVFADKLILFEGDAERLLLKYLISNIDKYENLSDQYISYIQVGGAYAHKYLDLIDFLQIKSLIFTDIDYIYEKEDLKKEIEVIHKEIIKRETTNETIKKVVGKSIIFEIYKKADRYNGVFLSNKNVCLKFQTSRDGYSRTLEDALLHKLLSYETVFSKISKNELRSLIKEKNLLLTNTTKGETSLRDRVDKLKNKTDFIFSLIESGNINDAIPSFIEEGLVWLKD